MTFKDYYKILRVRFDADIQDIKQAYRRQARKYHPDVNSAVDAVTRFLEVTEAYDVLSDQAKRREYNMFCRRQGNIDD